MFTIKNHPFYQTQSNAFQPLETMRTKIQTVKENPAIQNEKIRENEALYQTLKNFADNASALIKLFEEITINQSEFEIKNDRKVDRKITPNKFYDKEAFRLYHTIQIEKRWPELY